MEGMVFGWVGSVYNCEIIYHSSCKKNIIICKNIHTFYIKKLSKKL